MNRTNATAWTPEELIAQRHKNGGFGFAVVPPQWLATPDERSRSIMAHIEAIVNEIKDGEVIEIKWARQVTPDLVHLKTADWSCWIKP